MGAAETLIIINGLLGIAFRAYQSYNQIEGNEPIPEWDELVDKNRLLQEKIDAEK